MYDFTYQKPSSLNEAAQLLAADPEAKLIAGGQTYIPTLKQRLAQPSTLVDLGKIAELKAIREEGGGVTIGAMAKHRRLDQQQRPERRLPCRLRRPRRHHPDEQARAPGRAVLHRHVRDRA
jgi:aerobic carbon-monoxide dehydrogenase medium subunit